MTKTFTRMILGTAVLSGVAAISYAAGAAKAKEAIITPPPRSSGSR